MSTFLSATQASTAATSTAAIVTAAFALSGSNRALAIGIGVGNSGAQTMTPSRGSDTFSSATEQVTGSERVYLFGSTNEPQTASTALTVTRGAATTYWGFCVLAATAVDQTTRITNVTLNTDVLTTGGLDTLTLPTDSTGDLACDFFGTRGGYNGSAITPGGSQTDRAGFHTGTASFDQSVRMSTQPGTGGNVSMSWSGFASGVDIYHIGFTLKSGSTPPVNTVTADSEIIPDLDAYTAVPTPPTVASGSSAITSVVVSCDVGTLNFTASGSVTLTSNNSSSVTLQNGATDTEYNTVLGTMKHSRSTHGQTTFTIVPSDGTLSDSDQFTRLVSPQGLTISGTHAEIRLALPTLLTQLDLGETSGTFEIIATDSGARTDTQTVTLSVYAAILGAGSLIARRRRRRS